MAAYKNKLHLKARGTYTAGRLKQESHANKDIFWIDNVLLQQCHLSVFFICCYQ